MAKYRVVKYKRIYDPYVIEKKHWLTGKWVTIDSFNNEEYALNAYCRLVDDETKIEKIIIESK